jgi:hypothetical protein
MKQQEEIRALIIELLVGVVGTALFTGPAWYRCYEAAKTTKEPQEFSSRQVKLVAELMKEREGWTQLPITEDLIHTSGVRYWPCMNGYGFYTIQDDNGREIPGILTQYDRQELHRLYTILARDMKDERQSELTRTLARRVVSGERVEAEPVAEQLDVEPVKSLGFNPLAGTSWEDTYTSAGVSINHSPGRLMLTAGAVSGNELHKLQLELQRKVREMPDPAKQSELYI